MGSINNYCVRSTDALHALMEFDACRHMSSQLHVDMEMEPSEM